MLDTSAFGNQLMQGFIDARNPINKLVVTAFENDAQDSELTRDQSRRDFIKELNRDLSIAKEDGSDAAYVDGLRRLIAKHTGKLQ